MLELVHLETSSSELLSVHFTIQLAAVHAFIQGIQKDIFKAMRGLQVEEILGRVFEMKTILLN